MTINEKEQVREIKFRIWNTELKDWRTLSIRGNSVVKTSPSDKIMQFTGLKDKNGKEIFEGDIIKIGGAYDDENYSIFEITFEEGAFIYRFIKSIEGKENTTGLSDSNYLRERKVFLDCEVIGNIYENPELIEVNEIGGSK